MTELKGIPKPGTRTWGDGTRCDECCNKDGCDDPTHYDRTSKYGCPHCLNTGYALWRKEGREAYELQKELIAEAKARANIATQKMNEQFHNESVKSESEDKQIEERVESWPQTYGILK